MTVEHTPACSFSAAITAHLPPDPAPWSVLSSHRHSCNLINQHGNLLALVTPTHGNGPFHVVTPLATLPELSPHTAVHVGAMMIQLPAFRIDLRGTPPWSPQLACLHTQEQTVGSVHRCCHILCEVMSHQPSPLVACGPNTPSAALARLAQPALVALHTGLIAGDLAQIAHAARRLAGLGPGLTPAGDDFLVGWMAALWLAGTWIGLEPGTICAAVGATAAPHTTRLSAAWLTHAAAGRFGEAWHTLAAALAHGSLNAIQSGLLRIRDTGVTSGRDALAGFQHALVILRNGSYFEARSFAGSETATPRRLAAAAPGAPSAALHAGTTRQCAPG
ncbi:MAG: DUF2877 domain-containing protein [Caldilineaceae bacterium]|nr:DUF2877 domain-containing protein [Caldilineaceae bacterium]